MSFCQHQSRERDRGQFTCALGRYGGKPWLGNCLECVKHGHNTPDLGTMASSLATAAGRWARGGFKVTDEETLQSRLDICRTCEHWNSQGFGGTGRCMKCGCSTWAKARMATEKCPIGKW